MEMEPCVELVNKRIKRLEMAPASTLCHPRDLPVTLEANTKQSD